MVSDSEEQTNRDFVICQLVKKSLENLFDEVRQSMQTQFLSENAFHLQPFPTLRPVTQARFFYLQTFHFYDCKKRDGKGFFLAKLQSIKLHTQSVTRPLVYG